MIRFRKKSRIPLRETLFKSKLNPLTMQATKQNIMVVVYLMLVFLPATPTTIN